MSMSNLYSLFGGLVIGLAATLLLYFNGKIAGISGVISRSLVKPSVKGLWRYFFLGGLIVGGFVMRFISPDLFNYELHSSPLLLSISGFLVGFGTLLGNGCTSGHGVCGLPRLSLRSLVATLTFMLVAILTVLIKGVL